MRYKIYIVYMYRHMQNHTDILKILFFLPKLSCTLLGMIKVLNNCSVINYSEVHKNCCLKCFKGNILKICCY